MCSESCLDFVRRALTTPEVYDRTVLEVGSLDVNGSPRADVMAMGPRRYWGIDLAMGPGVDQIISISEYRENGFWDIVITCEMLEHVEDWRAVIGNLKRITVEGGCLIITTRSLGFPYHAFPIDCWRYEPRDMERIFADWTIEMLESDQQDPGVFVKARKPVISFDDPLDLSGIELYRMPAR